LVFLVARYDPDNGYYLDVYDVSGLVHDLHSSDTTFSTNPENEHIAARDTSYFFNGLIPILRIYSVIKSDGWISRRFEQTKGIFR